MEASSYRPVTQKVGIKKVSLQHDIEPFEVTNLPWFTAQEQVVQGQLHLTVYRSLLVKDDDKLYRPVADRLRHFKLIASDLVYDEDMMFGRAEWLLYRQK